MVKPRQFKQLLSFPPKERDALICEGLGLLGSRLRLLASEIDQQPVGVALELLAGIAGEEAGKALILIDIYRSPRASQAVVSRQLGRASQHLPKLLYRQMVDYRIGDRTELVGALHRHRLDRYLDGPNDVDWVFRNDLVAGRENDMYVDLVQTEDGLEWWPPLPTTIRRAVPDAVRLVLALQDAGMFAAGALKRLERSWVDFDPAVESHFGDWSDRTANALRGGPSASLAIACELWPMPMTELELEPIAVTDEEIEKARGM